MKQYFLLLMVLCSFSGTAQQGIRFSEIDLPEALTLSKTQHKPVFVMLYATWCTHCNKMKKEVLNQPEVGTFFNTNFITTWHDGEKDSGLEIGKKYGLRAFPTFLVFDSNGVLLYSFAGEFTIETLIQEGKNALNPTMQYPYLQAQFLEDETNADKCYAYVAALRKSNLDANVPAEQYLSKIKESDLVTPLNWKIIANGIREIDSREFQYVLKNQDAFAKVSSPKRVERKIVNIVQESLLPFAQLSDTINYNKNRPAAAAIRMVKTDSLIFKYDRMLCENTGNFKKYHEISSASIKKFSWNYPSEINEIVSFYLKNIDDKKALREAVSWEEHSAELKESKETYLLLANLNVKLNNNVAAKKWAEKARNFCLQYSFDTKDADEIINQIK